MSTVHRFRRDDLVAQPWKNGGGMTREILSWPPGSTVSDFDWRVSIAHIASSGPFSVFPGVDRVISLLEGAGVALHSLDGGINHRLDHPLTPFAFSGDVSLQADLLGPDCHDFNVMTRRSTCTATVQVLGSAAQLPPRSQGLFWAYSGQWVANSETLAAGEGLYWHGELGAWSLIPQSENAALISVLIQPSQ